MKKNTKIPMRQKIDDILKVILDIQTPGTEVSDIDSIVYSLMSLPREYSLVLI